MEPSSVVTTMSAVLSVSAVFSLKVISTCPLFSPEGVEIFAQSDVVDALHFVFDVTAKVAFVELLATFANSGDMFNFGAGT